MSLLQPTLPTLHPLLHSDIPTAAHICGQAMSRDKHTLLKAAHRTSPYNHEKGMLGAFEYWLSSKNAECVKAVDSSTTTGRMLGVVVWFKQLPAAASEVPPPGVDKDEDEDEAEADEKIKTEESREEEKKPTDPLAQLEALTTSHLTSYQARIQPAGTKALVIGTLAVDPSAQNRGVGSLLIKHGTEIADREGALCWVHSSDDEGAVKVYAKAGFVLDDVLVVRLDEWARKAGIEGRFGDYRFRYMVRWPRSKPK